MASSLVPATNQQTQVTVMSDNDFFSLETGQGGTWIRHISGSATLSFKINTVQRDGNNVTVSYSYATSTATAYVYLKESSASSFPQSPTVTFSLTGSGYGTLNLTLATDSSYEIQFIVSDGKTNLYVFASVDSNVLLIEVDNNGNVRAAGDIEDGYGNKLSEMIDLFYPVGSYYETSLPSPIPSGASTPNATDLANLGVTWFNPQYAWGGTWVLETGGLVHVSSGGPYSINHANDNDGAGSKDGGNKDAIVPYHRHSVESVSISSSGKHAHHGARRPINTVGGSGLMYVGPNTSTSDVQDAVVTKEDGGHTHSVPSHNTNYEPSTDNRTNANIQPYIEVNRWHRTA